MRDNHNQARPAVSHSLFLFASWHSLLDLAHDLTLHPHKIRIQQLDHNTTRAGRVRLVKWTTKRGGVSPSNWKGNFRNHQKHFRVKNTLKLIKNKFKL